MCSTDSGTNILMYTKQVLSKAALYIRPRKVQPSSKTVRAESPLPFSGKKKTFVISKRWWHSLLKSPLMFRSKWKSPKVNVNYMTAISLHQYNTIEYHFSLKKSYW